MPPAHSEKYAVASEKSCYDTGLVAAQDGNARPQQYDYPSPQAHVQAPYPHNVHTQLNPPSLQPHNLPGQIHAPHLLAPSGVAFGPHGPGTGPGPGADAAREGDHNARNVIADHRTPRAYPNVALPPHVSQSRTLSSTVTSQQPYASPILYAPQANLQSPFLNNQHQFQTPQAQSDTPNYFQPNQSPRSQSSGAGTFYPTEKPDSMAATATMQRPYPPIYTPQSNSPASVTSPQSHDPGRPMYPQPGAQLSQLPYGYPQYQSMSQVHQPPYGAHHGQTQQHQIQSQPMMPYQSAAPQLQQTSQHHSTISNSPRLKSEPGQSYQQTPQPRPGMLPHQQQQPQHSNANPPAPGLGDYKQTLQQAQQQQPGQQQQQQQQQQQSPSGVPPNMPPNSNAAPGPIPATTPLVVRQDGNGVQWIAFEYSRDRVKMEYTIRCDVESVDGSALTHEFKSENCVYPRACVPKDLYKGNRLNYETDCNQVGWALAELNPCLRGKRGLIQRAVDSWRNSNQDPRMRSRRVRRQAKMNHKGKVTPTTPSQASAPSLPLPTGLAGPGSMPAPSARPPGVLPSAQSQILHNQQDVSPSAHGNVGASPYNNAPQGYRQDATVQHMQSPNDVRQSHVFPGYPNYPSAPTSMAPSMAPQMQGGLHHLGRSGGTAAMTSRDLEGKNEEDNALFGDLPESKRRKFILVEDTQKNARVRVKVTLEQIEMSEIPDSYRKQNAVFPRAYFPVQMQTATDSTRDGRLAEEGEEVDGGAPTIGKTSVSVQTGNGNEEVSVPQISKSKRGREQKINELGYRMAWGQGRVFSGRPIFLARALDAYRAKQRSALLLAGSPASTIPAHLENRPGKRKWLERARPIAHPLTPPTTTSD